MSGTRVYANAALLLAGLALLPCPSIAQQVTVPPRQQYALFAKILTFDRNLAARAGDELVIGVVFQPGLRASRAAADEFIVAANESPIRSVAGVPVRVRRIALDNPATLADALAREEVDVVYFAPLRAVDISALLAATRARRILSFSSAPEYVGQGVAVGLDERGGKPHILINLPSARAEGADFGSTLLGLAEVFR